MTEVCGHILDHLGHGPIVRIDAARIPGVNLFAKLEGYNPTGSVKDRAAAYITEKLLATREIRPSTLIVESSSGNFGIALAAVCKRLGLRFRCVIDPRISRTNEMMIRSLGAEVVKVTERDPSGGYLQTRIAKIKEILTTEEDAYWVNQYANPLNAEAYAETLGKEICESFEKLDYLFVGVSSGGTVTGLSQKVKAHYRDIKVIAVDAAGSAIFGGPIKKRWIPGIGSSLVPAILQHARIDEAVIVEEIDAVSGCHELLRQHAMFVGGSSGTVFAGVRSYFAGKDTSASPNVLAIFADRGDRYVDTVFNDTWCENLRVGLLSIPPPAMPLGGGE